MTYVEEAQQITRDKAVIRLHEYVNIQTILLIQNKQSKNPEHEITLKARLSVSISKT